MRMSPTWPGKGGCTALLDVRLGDGLNRGGWCLQRARDTATRLAQGGRYTRGAVFGVSCLRCATGWGCVGGGVGTFWGVLLHVRYLCDALGRAWPGSYIVGEHMFFSPLFSSLAVRPGDLPRVKIPV
jgi:hypothetical protein